MNLNAELMEIFRLFDDDRNIVLLLANDDKLKLLSYLKTKSTELSSKFKEIKDTLNILDEEWILYIKYEKALSILGDLESTIRINKWNSYGGNHIICFLERINLIKKPQTTTWDKICELIDIALRSDPPVADLNVREQGDICGHMSTDIPIVPDRVGAGSLRVQDRSAVFSASGGKDSLIEPATSGQLANEDLYEEYKKAKSLAIELEKSNIWSQISDI